MSRSTQGNVKGNVDWLMIWLYLVLVATGILCIFMVEYNPDAVTFKSFISGDTNYSKQLLFTGFCLVIGLFILLSDSKLYTAFANLLYAFGILLMLLVFVIGKSVNGSRSWIPLGGGFNLQPAELCKIFTALALAKYLSLLTTNFTKLHAQVIAAVICLLPAVLSIGQSEQVWRWCMAAFLL